MVTVTLLYNVYRVEQPWIRFGQAWTLGVIVYLFEPAVGLGRRRVGAIEPCAQFLARQHEERGWGYQRIRGRLFLLIPGIVASWWGGGALTAPKARDSTLHLALSFSLWSLPVCPNCDGSRSRVVRFRESREEGRPRQQGGSRRYCAVAGAPEKAFEHTIRRFDPAAGVCHRWLRALILRSTRFWSDCAPDWNLFAKRRLKCSEKRLGAAKTPATEELSATMSPREARFAAYTVYKCRQRNGSPGSVKYNALAELQVIENKWRKGGDSGAVVDSREHG